MPALRLVATASTSSARRLPLTVLAAGLIGILEAVGLLAVAVGGIDGVLTSARPAGWTLALGLSVLAAWVVLCAGSGAGLIEGTGRRLLVGLAYGEIGPGRGPAGGRHRRSRSFTPPAGLPLPVLALLVLAVPVGKLLLAAAPSARQWVADGPRPRAPRPDPVAAHRLLATRDPRGHRDLAGRPRGARPGAGAGRRTRRCGVQRRLHQRLTPERPPRAEPAGRASVLLTRD